MAIPYMAVTHILIVCNTISVLPLPERSYSHHLLLVHDLPVLLVQAPLHLPPGLCCCRGFFSNWTYSPFFLLYHVLIEPERGIRLFVCLTASLSP